MREMEAKQAYQWTARLAQSLASMPKALLPKALLPMAFLAACGASDNGEIGEETFDAISPDETIKLTGTEPFWNITVEGDTLTYTTPDNPDGAPTSVSRFNGNNGLGLSGQIEGELFVIAVTQSECSDAMSDRLYPFVATVQIGETLLNGCGYSDSNPYTGDETP